MRNDHMCIVSVWPALWLIQSRVAVDSKVFADLPDMNVKDGKLIHTVVSRYPSFYSSEAPNDQFFFPSLGMVTNSLGEC
jgi:hypothetical protein